MKKIKFLVRSGVLAVLCGMAASLSHALQITPTYQIFQLEPGERQKASVTLFNDGPLAITVTPSFKEWVLYPDTKHIKPNQWLSLDGDSFVLQPGQSRVVAFRIQAPKIKGEVMAMLSFSLKEHEEQTLTYIVSVGVYLSIKNTERYDAKLSEMAIQMSSNTQVALTISNTGNTHLRLNGWVEISNAEGVVVMNITYNDNKVFFPEHPNMLVGQIQNARLDEGRYSAKITLTDVVHHIQLTESRKFWVRSDGAVKF